MSSPTVEDAKRVQKLSEHLKTLRKHRDFLADKRTIASGVTLRIELTEHEVPQEVRRKKNDRDVYYEGLRYVHHLKKGWAIISHLSHGTIDDAEYYNENGMLPSVGTRIMDGVRAAVADEIETTEKAITKLGFSVP